MKMVLDGFRMLLVGGACCNRHQVASTDARARQVQTTHTYPPTPLLADVWQIKREGPQDLADEHSRYGGGGGG